MPDPRRIGLLPAAGVDMPRPRFRSLGISASGLSAQRARMETIAQNIANADVTRTAEGGPYRRRHTIIEAATQQNSGMGQQPAIHGTLPVNQAPFGAAPFQIPAIGDVNRAIPIPIIGNQSDGMHGVRVAGTEADATDEGRLLYEPGHPDADQNGYVRYPNVDPTQELVQLLDAKRLYEANATVFQTAKQMLRAALDI